MMYNLDFKYRTLSFKKPNNSSVDFGPNWIK